MTLSAFVIRLLFLALPGILGSKFYRKLRGRSEKEQWESILEILLFSIVSYSIVHLAGFDRSNDTAVTMYAEVIPPVTIQSADPVYFPGPPGFSIPATQPTTVQPQTGTAGKSVKIQISHPVTIASTQPVSIDGLPVAIGPGQTVTIQPENTGPPASSIFQAFITEQVAIGGYVKTIVYATVVALLLALAASYFHTYALVNRFGRFAKSSRRSGDEDTWTAFNNSDNVEWVIVRDPENDRAYYGSVHHYSDSGKTRELVLTNVEVYKITTDERLYCTTAV